MALTMKMRSFSTTTTTTTKTTVLLLLLIVLQSCCCHAAEHTVTSSSNTNPFHFLTSVRPILPTTNHYNYNATEFSRKRQHHVRMQQALLQQEKQEKYQRIQARRQAAREKLSNDNDSDSDVVPPPPPNPNGLQRMTSEQIQRAARQQQQKKSATTNNIRGRRQLAWWSNYGDYDAYGEDDFLADVSEDYDKWAQAYRMLGGYIDCDNAKEEDDHHSGDNQNNNQQNDDSACSRWMLWAAYVNEDYQGNEYDEYFGDDPTSYLDCHSPSPTTNWKLLGVYRQEFYQFIEQISKHLWAIDEYEYIVALAGLSYMTDYDCFSTGSSDSSGNSIYAGVAPQSYGGFQMALYTDSACLYPADSSLGMTYDDFGFTTDVDLGSNDQSRSDSSTGSEYDIWSAAQEYTLTNLNEVYDSFRYCTSCVDYPTYQDGYFIGDDGTDDDDLINQCWKFWSHDSFVCGGDCLTKAHAQGTILSVAYNGVVFGKTPDAFYTYRNQQSGGSSSSSSTSASKAGESKWSRLAANAFLTMSFLIFVATFLAFAVARRSRQRERRSGKSRRLLDGGDPRRSGSSGKRRSSSHHKEGDGVFRSKSSDRKNRSGASIARSKSKSRRHDKEGYEPPRSSRDRSGDRRSSSRNKSSSRTREDEF